MALEDQDSSPVATVEELLAQGGWQLLEQGREWWSNHEPVGGAGMLLKADRRWERLLMPRGNALDQAAQGAAFRARAAQTGALGALYLTEIATPDGFWPEPGPPTQPGRSGPRGDPRGRSMRALALLTYTPTTVHLGYQEYSYDPGGAIHWGAPFSVAHPPETIPADPFDPFPREGRAPEPDLEELALKAGIAVALLRGQDDGADDPGPRKVELLTDPAAVVAHHLAEQVQTQLLEEAMQQVSPGHEKPWRA